MDNTKFRTKTLEQQLEEIYVILKTIQLNQENNEQVNQKNHAANMKKLSKLQEFNQIADMTNQIFEIRITGIEEAIKNISKGLLNEEIKNKKA